jgi:EAL domain-containing protein (putative c-di-GMP-specific phosphodiesterase class I)
VEKESQLSMLKNLGCDAIQGFLISEALPADLFEAFLQNDKGFLPGS